MITIIAGSNRKGSLTKVFAEKYREILSKETNQKIQLLALEELPHDWFLASMYQGSDMPDSLKAIQEQYILPARGFIVLSPEYNGSFPGVLKLFIDACSVRKYTENFKGKKAAFIGIASGRAGNLRGMGHLASIFNHLGATTMPNQLPLSSVEALMNENDQVVDEDAIAAMTAHAREFVAF